MKKFTFRTTIHCTLDIEVIADDLEEATDRLNDRVYKIKLEDLQGSLSGYEEDLISTSDDIDIDALMYQAESIIDSATRHGVAFDMNYTPTVSISRQYFHEYKDFSVDLDGTVRFEYDDLVFNLSEDSPFCSCLGEDLTIEERMPIYQAIINSAEANGINPKTFEIL